MTPSELKRQCQAARIGEHFFDRRTMQFFGDTMKNYGVRSTSECIDRTGKPVGAWELYRKHPVKNNLKTSAYFSKETLEKVYPK